ncbi:hypothetical protein, partial [Pontibacter rugosus]
AHRGLPYFFGTGQLCHIWMEDVVYIPFTFYILYSYAYLVHFTAYSIHTIEKELCGKPTEYTALLLGLFFFPIGIWLVQPKINRILRTPVVEEITNT